MFTRAYWYYVLVSNMQYRYAHVNIIATCTVYRYCILVSHTCMQYRYARVNIIATGIACMQYRYYRYTRVHILETCMQYMCAGLNPFKLGELYVMLLMSSSCYYYCCNCSKYRSQIINITIVIVICLRLSHLPKTTREDMKSSFGHASLLHDMHVHNTGTHV